MWDRHPASLALVHMLPDVAERRGVALPPLLARAGITEDVLLPPPDRIVTRAQICTLLQEVARRAGEPTIGLDLAASADPARLGLAGRALFAGRTLGECLSAQARHMPGLHGGVRIALDQVDGMARWRHVLADSDPDHARVLNEGVAAFMAAALRAITGSERAPLHVSLPHRAPAPARIYEDKLGAGVSFGTGGGVVITFDAAWLERPSQMFGTVFGAAVPPMTGDTPPLAADAVRFDDATLLAGLGRIFESAALAGTLSLIDASRSLGLAPRSLQRRLAGLGTSFEALVDGWRHAQARLHLADTVRPVGSVARALGYGDPAHFVRAFRRWEGVAPLAFRRKLQEADERPARAPPADGLAPNGN